jgi:hypothetical protein
MTGLNLASDTQGHCIYAPATSALLYNATLGANVSANLTIPSTYPKYVACFTYKPGSNVWVDLSGATAIVPVGANLAACTAEQNPAQRIVYAGGKISMVTSDVADDVGVALYATP